MNPLGGVAAFPMLLFRTLEHAKNHAKMGLKQTIISFNLLDLVLLLCSLLFFLAQQWGGIYLQGVELGHHYHLVGPLACPQYCLVIVH